MQLTYGLIALAATTLLTLSEARQCVSFQLGSKGTSVAQQRQLLTRQLCPNKQPHTSVRSRIRGTATSEAVDATSEAVDSRMPAKDWISEWKESPTIRKIVLKKIEREHKTMLGKELRDRRKQGHVIQYIHMHIRMHIHAHTCSTCTYMQHDPATLSPAPISPDRKATSKDNTIAQQHNQQRTPSQRTPSQQTPNIKNKQQHLNELFCLMMIFHLLFDDDLPSSVSSSSIFVGQKSSAIPTQKLRQ
mmetsp:Transcript_17550/g.31490  ORF Transcript_17550/g.31490 Transcript_17550/m.31490 type:complete len:246 (+) Transcript_17550:278-1015(+)